jgi:hypothetical protein
VRDDVVAVAARAAAKELAPEYGARIEAEVEAALYGAGEVGPPSQFTDPVAVSALIVGIAQLAYPIYSDYKKRGEKLAKDTLTRRVRVKARETRNLTQDDERVIEIVVEQIITLGDDE